MHASADRFLAAVTGPPDVQEIYALAESGYAPAARPKVNTHVHLPPNFSAFAGVGQAVAMAKEEAVRVLGASNYYDYRVYSDLAGACHDAGIFPLFGIEIIVLIDELVKAGMRINDPANPGKMYLCGKGIVNFDPMTDEAKSLLQTIRDADSARMEEVVARLSTVFSGAGLPTGLSAEAVRRRIADRYRVTIDAVYLQERHAAQAFQEVLFENAAEGDRAGLLERAYGAPPKASPADAVGTQNEMRSQLMKTGKAAYVAETFVDFRHAYRLILALGGIPAYPVLIDGASPICEFEASIPDLIESLLAHGVYGVEFIPIRNRAPVLSKYVHALREAGFFVTAGTEHNTLDLLPIEPACVGGEPVPDDVAEIFWEGACVVAAHQYLAMNGFPGFVNADGEPNANYRSDPERIEAFRRLGAAFLAGYMEASATRR